MDEMSDLPPWVLNEIRRIATPEVDDCIRAARDIAGFTEFPETLRTPFQYFHEFITKPQPQFITDLRANPKYEHWYYRLINGILGNTQSAFECVYYHYFNVLDMESRLIDRLAQGNHRNVMGSASLSIGNTKRLDFEYQAFVFAYRRALEYLARSIAAYFKTDCNSFKDLPKAIIRTKAPGVISSPLLTLHPEWVKTFRFVLSSGNEHRSIRDEIAHYSFVSAGSINLSSSGFMVAGGGEGLEPFSGKSLSDAHKTRVDQLTKCLSDAIYVFTDALRAYHTPG
jgi:hypothetical protein